MCRIIRAVRCVTEVCLDLYRRKLFRSSRFAALSVSIAEKDVIVVLKTNLKLRQPIPIKNALTSGDRLVERRRVYNHRRRRQSGRRCHAWTM